MDPRSTRPAAQLIDARALGRPLGLPPNVCVWRGSQ